MSRLKRAAAILDAAEKWKQRCLLEGGSLFSDERLWTLQNFRQLHTHFVERPDAGAGSFEEKLRRQLEPAAPGGEASVGGNDVAVLLDRGCL